MPNRGQIAMPQQQAGETYRKFDLRTKRSRQAFIDANYERADLGQLSDYMAMAKHVLNTPGDNHPVGLLICKEHNRVLAKYHLEELGLPMGITDYELKKVLPTKAQLAKCVADAERQIETARKGEWQ